MKLAVHGPLKVKLLCLCLKFNERKTCYKFSGLLLLSIRREIVTLHKAGNCGKIHFKAQVNNIYSLASFWFPMPKL